ncbi:YkvA family protein [Microbacterium phosphatis]|uniref:YkvA family protein n=1 Tax=Microbacterium phosphatis TaxID=3140248 RepID=UPI003140A31E
MNTRRVIGSVLVGAAALVYGASPIDIIPELLGPIGLADDAAVMVGAGLTIWRMLRHRKPK